MSSQSSEDSEVLFSCENGGLTSSATNAAPATAETVRQEVKLHLQCCCSDGLVDPYSDNIGFPTLPRPRTVISRAKYASRTLPLASLLSTTTTPAVVTNGWGRDRKLEALHPAATHSVKVNNPEHAHTSFDKQKSLNGTIAAVSLQDLRCGVVQSKKVSTVATSVVFNSIHEREMSIRQRKPQYAAAAVAAAGEENEKGANRPKKTRKALRSLTFAFGSNSECRRRSLSVFGKGEKKTEEVNAAVSKNLDTLPVSPGLSVPDGGWSEYQVHPKCNETVQQNQQHYSSYQDISIRSAGSPSQRYKQQHLNLSSLIGRYTARADLSQRNEEESSVTTDYSPAFSSTSGNSSFRNSPELIGSCVNDMSQSQISTNHKLDSTPPSARRKLSDPITPDIDDLKGTLLSSSSSSALSNKRNSFCIPTQPDWDMRQHVVQFLVETEKSYVASLNRIVKEYFDPLKRSQATLVDSNLAREIFYQIPEICSIHERLLQQLMMRVNCWDSQKKIGDIFVNTFSKCQLMDVYSKFIGNFMRAKANIEVAKQAKPVFAKFLEQRARDSEGRLTLDDLLIKPVQRIPRYVLFIKDLLKYTPPSHPDHAPLQMALGELTMLAERFNDSEKERERTDHLKDLLNAVDGLSQLLSTQSYFIRYDMITEVKGQVQKRDRFLILFSDILVCAASRRKSSTFKKNSLLNLTSVFSEKFNIKWHLPLSQTSLPRVPSLTCDRRRLNTLEKMLENFQRDDGVLERLTELSAGLHHPHQALVTVLKDLQAEIKEGMAIKRTELDNLPMEYSRVDLIGSMSPIFTQHSVLFPSQKIRHSWEEDFVHTKKTANIQQVGLSHCPELDFKNSVLLQSGSIGIQLTCAAEGLSVNSGEENCLWVCSSDRLGGKVSLVNLKPSTRPRMSANITVAGSPITCIGTIPSSLPPSSPSSCSLPPPHNTITLPPPNISISSTSSTSSSSSSSPNSFRMTISPTPSGSSDVKGVPCDKDDDLMFLDGDLDLLNQPHDTFLGNLLSVQTIRSNSAPPCQTTLESEESVPETGQWNLSNTPESMQQKVWSALTLRPLAVKEVEKGCGHCMWLGTEGGQVLIYGPGDNIRSLSSRRVVDLNSHIHCITHVQGNVYVGLEDGNLAILDLANPHTLPRRYVVVGSSAVRCCVSVMGEVWVGCGGTVYQLDLKTYSVKTLCSLPGEQTIRSAVACGSSVWVSVDRSSLLHLIHAPSGTFLTSVDCMRPVMDILKPYNLIIRQHKSAALQITSLLLAPSHLVVGTSAGVVLAIPLPYIEPSLEPHPLQHPPIPTPLHHGHVDMVHFLSLVQRGEETLVVTGGSGCEDFHKVRSSSEIPETASCLLLWSVKQ